LTACPIIEGEDSLKLINYQHNQIKLMGNFEQMRNLIFLDLYDNKIERINGLSTLTNLRVLMLGKNRIQRIENLANLAYLDILDLHGNQVSQRCHKDEIFIFSLFLLNHFFSD
jgi:leucine-rich repeat-containing protein 49